MITREELVRTEEYWFEIIQNQIYRKLEEYLTVEGINQTQLAERLGVTKGYISQLMNGNFNYSLKKLIELSLSLNMAPVIEFVPLNELTETDNLAKTRKFGHKERYASRSENFINQRIMPAK